MAALSPHLNETKFVRWTTKGSHLPLRWDDALSRLIGSPIQRSQKELLMGCIGVGVENFNEDAEKRTVFLPYLIRLRLAMR